MHYRKITAIIPSLALEEVEQSLLDFDIPGMTISKAHGMGEYRNYYANDRMTDCCRVEVFIEENEAKQIANIIASTVHKGMSTDGVIAILPVEDFMHIKDYRED